MAENIGKEMQRFREEMLRDVIKAVQIDSSKSAAAPGMPFGKEAADALNFCLALGRDFGFTVKNLENRAGHIEYGEGEPLVGVLAHVDVVPAGEGWTFPPFGGTYKDGRIYGRGTMDDKGPAVAAIYCIRALKELGIKPKGRIRVILGASEESGMEDMDYYFANEPLPDLGFTPDGEYPICNREKGILQLTVKGDARGRIITLRAGSAPNMVPERAKATVKCVAQEAVQIEEAALKYEDSTVRFEIGEYENGKLTIECFGRAAHASTPELGKNAVTHLIRLLSDLDMVDEGLPSFINHAIGTRLDGGALACSDDSGVLTLNLGIVEINEGAGKAVIDIRYPVSASGKEIADGLLKEAETYGLRADIEKDIVPLFVSPDSPLIQKLSSAYQTVTGQAGGLYATGGGSYARTLSNCGVAFGAGLKPLSHYRIHGADEFLEVEDFMKHCEICLQAMYELACL